MTLQTINIAGVNYPICFSVAALEEIDSRFGSLQKFGEYMEQDHEKLSEKFNALIPVLSAILKSGQIAASVMSGAASPAPPSDDILPHLIPIWDTGGIIQAIFACLYNDSARAQEANPPKNAGSPLTLPAGM